MSIELAPTISGVPVRRWKRYPAYRDSGVEWLGEVPEEWITKKIKHTTYVKGRIGWKGLKSDEFIEEGPYLVTGTDFIDGKVNWETCYHVSNERYDEDPYIQLHENDLLITKDGTIGKTAIVENLPDNACLNSGIFLTRSISGDYITEFMHWLLNSVIFTKFIDYTKTGTTINHLYQNVFVDFAFPVPPFPEQHAIAAFLDRKTGRIDTLIEKKERQVELLQEKRAALISHVVTKGLDPDVTMKDSGVEWLGEVPEHWNILALRRVVSRFVDYRGKTPEKIYKGVPLITAKNIKDGHIDLSQSQEFMREDEYQDWMTRGWPEIGDVLITTEAPLGEVAQVEDTFIALAQRIILLKVNKSRIVNDYLKYHFLSMSGQGELWTRASGSTALGIKAERFKGTLVSVPPLNEQQKITQYLDSEIYRLQRPSSKVRESILKLREYRTALISAAVTGKIDVREDLVT